MQNISTVALIVDDSATARYQLGGLLRSLDLETRDAASGEAGLEHCQRERIDLVFLDHLMPGIDGFETLRRLKENPQTAAIPVIMFTSQNAPRYQQEARALGAAGVIDKQIDRQTLALVIERALLQAQPGQPEERMTRTAAGEATDESSGALMPSALQRPHVPNAAQHEHESTHTEPLDAMALLAQQADLRRLQHQIRWHRLSLLLLAGLTVWSCSEQSALEARAARQDATLVLQDERLSDQAAQINRHEESLRRMQASQEDARRVMADLISIVEDAPVSP